MKKIYQEKLKCYPPVKLYLDDIQAICSIFEENESKYIITTDTHKFDTYSEFASYYEDQTNRPGRRIRRLQISSFTPYICLDLSSLHTTLFASHDDNESRGIFSRIDDCMQATRRFPLLRWFLFSPDNFFAVLLVLMSLGLLGQFLSAKFLPSVILRYGGIELRSTSLALTLHLIFCLISVVVSFKRHSLIFPYKKHENLSFLARNKDALLVKIIGVSLILAATFFAGRYFR